MKKFVDHGKVFNFLILQKFFQFFDKNCDFFKSFLKIFVGFLVYQASKAEESPLGFDNSLPYNFEM